MALPISVPYSFANATTSIPLSQLDTDISTIYATVNGIGNGTVALSNVVITGGIVSNVSGISTSAISNGTSNVSIATANGSVTVATAGNTAMTIDTSQNATVAGTVAMASSFKRNRIINGNMQVWQRGTAPAAGALGGPTYNSVDRFYFQSGTTSSTISQSTSVPSGFRYSTKFQRTAGSTGTSIFYQGQIIESVNCYDLSGQTVTLSFWAKAGANYSSASNNLTVVVFTGTAADQGASYPVSAWTGAANPLNSTISLTTTWTKYTLTGTFGSGVLETAVVFYFTPTGTAGADDSIFITGVQLEVGTKATPYEMQIYSDQLAQCQRYYEKSYDISVVPASITNAGANFTITTASGGWRLTTPFKVTKRATPSSVVAYSPITGASGVYYDATSASDNAIGLVASATNSLVFSESAVASASTAVSFQYTASSEL